MSEMNEFCAVTKALSDPNRVRALLSLRQGELCACQIIELLGLAPSTVSRHMSVLKQAGLVKTRKEERWMYYRLPDENDQSTMIRSAIAWAVGAVKDAEDTRRDRDALKGITRQNPSSLCKMQRGR